MSELSIPPARPRPPRRRRRGRWLLAGIVAAALAFLVGLAVGRALEEGPRPGGTQTGIRTLTPLPAPGAATTVTVTTGG